MTKSGAAETTGLEPTAALLEWRDRVRTLCGLECRRVPWSEGRLWRRAGGQLVHQTGGFFAISGARAESSVADVDGIEQPIVVQPEVGILGFLVRQAAHGPQLLMQAKAEPGNVGAVQLAPTVQATVSNYTRLHDGEPTSYLEYFLPKHPAGAVADSLQSEQGTRFLNKYNRNITVRVEGSGPERVSDVWRWCDVTTVLELLNADFSVNTDARSALVCGDWTLFAANGRPFERWRGRGGFGESLLGSFLSEHSAAEANSLSLSLERMRNGVTLKTSLKPLKELDGWRLSDDGISDVGEIRFEIPMYRVSTGGREIQRWDQPLLRDYREGLAVLLCQRRRGVLRFLLRGSVEIGFSERVQFGPSIQEYCLGNVSPLLGEGEAIVRAESRQSDEGGRFDRSIGTYRIVELVEGEPVGRDPLACWATLGQICETLKVPGLFNNELRSTLALLLPDL